MIEWRTNRLEVRTVTGKFTLMLLLSALAVAQTNKGRIAGSVFDTGGGVAPGARVKVINPGTKIFTTPGEAAISNAEYDAWAAFAGGRPARSTAQGAALLAQINAQLTANRLGTTNTLRPDFFHIQLPAGFYSANLNSFDITTLNGLKLYRMRQAYTSDRWGFVDVSTGRSGYAPRFVQIAMRLYFE